MKHQDEMLVELWRIRATLWEESGHDVHVMLRNLTQEAQEIMRSYAEKPLPHVVPQHAFPKKNPTAMPVPGSNR